MSDFVEKAKDLAGDNAEKIKDGVDKGTDIVDEKTGGKLGSANEKIDDAAAKVIDKLAD